MRHKKIAVVILAAGKGERLPSRRGKLFVPLNKKPLLLHTLEALKRAVPAGTFFCAFNPESLGALLEVLRGKQVHLVEGGVYRAESLFKVLSAVEPSDFDHILVHDGARPFVSGALVHRLFQGLKNADCCIPALPVRYTIKKITKGRVTTVERNNLYEIQTPQLFKAASLFKAYHSFKRGKRDVKKVYDDAQLIELDSGHVRIVPGDRFNLKITYPEDIPIAGNIIGAYNKNNIAF